MSGESASRAQTKSGPITDIYHVVGPGSLRRKGETHQAGDLVELKNDEAKSLTGLVAKGDPPKPPRPSAERQAGKYIVAGPGILRKDLHTYRAGDTVQLTAEEARKLGHVVKEP